MSIPTIAFPTHKLIKLGLRLVDTIHYQLTPEELIKDTLRLHQGELSDTEALVIKTGKFTGRCPKDRFIVEDEITADTINWNDINQPIEEKYFNIIFKKVTDYLNKLPELWIRDCYACADENYRINIRVITEDPSMNLFAYNMFLRPTEDELEDFKSDWHILSVPGLLLNANECRIINQNASVISFKHKTILIAGSGYTGEMKKSIFTILNYILPQEKNVLSMHCSANMGEDGDTAIFFGLSGTGKTTLSADPKRKLIGDDEHGWSSDGVFNFEGGCYAKCIDLREDKEPEIYNAVRFGALVENVEFYPGTNEINFNDKSITENTRVSYPLNFISNSLEPSVGNIPENIFLLTCDACGILPPVSKLTTGQAMYQFISGYTAKIAGTESGVNEPKPTFSACFGAPFMPLHPGKYAEMLGRKIKDNAVKVWLINTGWTGGSYGIGKRIKLGYTRAIVTAVLEGKLENAEFENLEVFNLAIPKNCPGVPSQLLNPQNTWPSKTAYSKLAKQLAGLFIANFKQYESGVNEEILASAPVF
ncbi:MAG TPA: phosphoenolpyruvate carboxykinase (ATP) [Puia sp.]|nr:phosphoenolpyruvate carboxykinase (ATP) [Puia sp.]